MDVNKKNPGGARVTSIGVLIMKNIDCRSLSKFKTSQDYSQLTLPELFQELFRACKDISEYRKQMVKECNDIRKETSNGRKVDEVI